MKCVLLLVIYIFLTAGLFGHTLSENTDSARATQIIVSVNHTFQLQENELKNILEADAVKDRHVVVVSIAGAFRQGKSFLMNFFLEYLYAKVSGIDLALL